MRLVGAVNAYQDAAMLARSLPALRPLVDRLVVVDGRYVDFPAYDESTPSSTDGTIDVARDHGAEVISPPGGLLWVDECVKRSAYLGACAEGDWVLVVDADEVVEGAVDRAVLAGAGRADWAVQHYNQDIFDHRLQFDPHDPEGVRLRNSIWIHRLFAWRPGSAYVGAHNALHVGGAMPVNPTYLGDDAAARFPGLRLRHVQHERPYERIFRKDRYYMALEKREEKFREFHKVR